MPDTTPPSRCPFCKSGLAQTVPSGLVAVYHCGYVLLMRPEDAFYRMAAPCPMERDKRLVWEIDMLAVESDAARLNYMQHMTAASNRCAQLSQDLQIETRAHEATVRHYQAARRELAERDGLLERLVEVFYNRRNLDSWNFQESWSRLLADVRQTLAKDGRA